MAKRDLVEDLKESMQSLGEEYGEEEDLSESIWLPVIIDSKTEKEKKEEILSDPSVKEMDLAQITEKEVYVRKADLVSRFLIMDVG